MDHGEELTKLISKDMSRINFKQFKLFTDITQKHTDTIDVSRLFADILYKKGSGIVMHDLALRIYRSEGEMQLSKEDVAIIKDMANSCCTPTFIDSLLANLVEI